MPTYIKDRKEIEEHYVASITDDEKKKDAKKQLKWQRSKPAGKPSPLWKRASTESRDGAYANGRAGVTSVYQHQNKAELKSASDEANGRGFAERFNGKDPEDKGANARACIEEVEKTIKPCIEKFEAALEARALAKLQRDSVDLDALSEEDRVIKIQETVAELPKLEIMREALGEEQLMSRTDAEELIKKVLAEHGEDIEPFQKVMVTRMLTQYRAYMDTHELGDEHDKADAANILFVGGCQWKAAIESITHMLMYGLAIVEWNLVTGPDIIMGVRPGASVFTLQFWKASQSFQKLVRRLVP